MFSKRFTRLVVDCPGDLGRRDGPRVASHIRYTVPKVAFVALEDKVVAVGVVETVLGAVQVDGAGRQVDFGEAPLQPVAAAPQFLQRDERIEIGVGVTECVEMV